MNNMSITLFGSSLTLPTRQVSQTSLTKFFQYLQSYKEANTIMKELTSQQFLNQIQLLKRSKTIIDEIPQTNFSERFVSLCTLTMTLRPTLSMDDLMAPTGMTRKKREKGIGLWAITKISSANPPHHPTHNF